MFYDVDYLLCPLPSLWRTVEFLKPWSIGYCVIRPNFCSTLLTSMSGDLNMFLGDFLGGLFGEFGWSGSCLHRFYIWWHSLREYAPGLLKQKYHSFEINQCIIVKFHDHELLRYPIHKQPKKYCPYKESNQENLLLSITWFWERGGFNKL